ncbi:TPA: DUF2202 domain-containing protein [Candidatus Gracilibacteria bacterium]|nr:DUF2202 domain-containing protein [Candidatus Gracilibacteria bacterium]
MKYLTRNAFTWPILSVGLATVFTVPAFAQNSTIIDSSQSISDFELVALEKMGEEEFLARDVYIALYDKWGTKTFSNISKSEQRHADQIIDLTTAYSIGNFSDHEVGVFHDEELQKLYTDLVAKGSVSEIEALTVGAIIEDLDIYDLETFLKEVENTDIQRVFDNLNSGSYNHMKAFISQLEKSNATYTPIYITEEQFSNVLNAEKENGSGHDGEECDHDNDSEKKKGKHKGKNKGGHDGEEYDHDNDSEKKKGKHKGKNKGGHDGEECDHDNDSEKKKGKHKGKNKDGHDGEECDHDNDSEKKKGKNKGGHEGGGSKISNKEQEQEQGFFAWIWSWF